MIIKISLILLVVLSNISSLEHGQQEELFGGDTFILDLTNIDHANGAEIPRNWTEEDIKIIPTNIDFSALKEAYAKENKAERFLPSRLFFDDDDKKRK